MNLERLVDVAAGRTPADLVLKGARVVNVLSNEVVEADLAIVGERIAGLGDYDGAETVDLSGCTVIPEDRKRPEKVSGTIAHAV